MARDDLPTSSSRMSSKVANRPRTRQRVHKEPPALDVPNINDDAAERKRVLNVLAQRRYRERKRQSRKPGSAVLREEPAGEPSDARGETLTHDEDATDQERQTAIQTQAESFVAAVAPRAPSIPAGSNDGFGGVISWDMALLGVPGSPVLLDFSCLADRDPEPPRAQLTNADNPCPQTLSSCLESQTSDDSVAWLGTPASPSLSCGGSGGLPFPDSYLLPVCELSTLKAFLRIANRIAGDKSSLWDINATSAFATPGSAPPTSHLPRTWQPTRAQLLIPHHPLLDFLPWPSVREKIIQLFSLPEDMRPPAAQSPTALVQFSYDLEDGAEGVRIWGGDPYDPANWEVGQVLFERWWFIFDSQVIEQSNSWRGMRGAAKLRITGSARTGELWNSFV